MLEAVALKPKEYLNASRLKGVFVPTVTPFMKSNGSIGIDIGSQRKHITRLVKNGVDGIFLGSSVGQGRDMDLATLEISVFEGLTAARTVNPEVPVVVGALRKRLKETIDIIWYADDIGADAVVVAPLYIDGELDQVFRAIHANSDKMPLILYNNPKFQNGANLPLEFIKDMGAYDKIIGIKDSSGDKRYFNYLLKKFRTDKKHVMQGDSKAGLEPDILDADGMVPVEANVYADAFLNLFKQSKANFDPKELQEILDFKARNKKNYDSTAAFIKSLLVQGKVFNSDAVFPA